MARDQNRLRHGCPMILHLSELKEPADTCLPHCYCWAYFQNTYQLNLFSINTAITTIGISTYGVQRQISYSRSYINNPKTIINVIILQILFKMSVARCLYQKIIRNVQTYNRLLFLHCFYEYTQGIEILYYLWVSNSTKNITVKYLLVNDLMEIQILYNVTFSAKIKEYSNHEPANTITYYYCLIIQI